MSETNTHTHTKNAPPIIPKISNNIITAANKLPKKIANIISSSCPSLIKHDNRSLIFLFKFSICFLLYAAFILFRVQKTCIIIIDAFFICVKKKHLYMCLTTYIKCFIYVYTSYFHLSLVPQLDKLMRMLHILCIALYQ